MSMIQVEIKKETLNSLKAYTKLLEMKTVDDTIDFIIGAFGSDIESFIREYNMIEANREYENSEEYAENQKKIDELMDRCEVLKSSNV